MNHTPARRVTNTGSKKNIGYVPSLKNERAIIYESLLERDYISLLEFDNDVYSYQEQPFTIQYNLGKRLYKYTPDFQVNLKNKVLVIEIKPYSKWQEITEDNKKMQKYIAGMKYCKSKGYEFKVVTDLDIRKGSFLENVKYLFGFSRLTVPSSVKLLLINLIKESGPVQISNLLRDVSSNKNESRLFHSYILSLLYSKAIQTDLSKPIDKNSNVFILR